MNIIAYNFSWMGFNIFLAILSLILGWLYYLTDYKPLKYIYWILWLMFVPNTIYLFTDVMHLTRQWDIVPDIGKITLLFQNFIIIFVGLITFILSMYPIEKDLRERMGHVRSHEYIILLNLLIGFGMVLGRVERVNSWYFITKPLGVLESALSILSSPEIILLVILFGLMANFTYFLFRDPIIKYINIYLNQAGEEEL